MITPRRDLDDEDTRRLTYELAHAAAVEHRDAVASVSGGITAALAGPQVRSDIHPSAADHLDDELADDVTYRAALAALSGVVQRSLRDFLA